MHSYKKDKQAIVWGQSYQKKTKSIQLNTIGVTLSVSEPVWIVAVGK